MRIFLTNGCFDILHVGHVSFFLTIEQLMKEDDNLYVCINSDDSIKELKGNGRPINNINERIFVLRNCFPIINNIDSFDNEEQLASIIKRIQPNFLVKGDDWLGKDITGSEYANSVLYIGKKVNTSTTRIINHIKRI
jgi:D-beta-D-heptose 7-phosphate kinase/D-beta-D-heptose 1-phosphate adenosyltransferase